MMSLALLLKAFSISTETVSKWEEVGLDERERGRERDTERQTERQRGRQRNKDVYVCVRETERQKQRETKMYMCMYV